MFILGASDMIAYTYLESPVGRLLLAGSHAGLKCISFQQGLGAVQPEPDWNEETGLFAEATRQLRAYFKGGLREFSLALAPDGTMFQQAVWTALRGIPYGTTISYGEIARRIGKPQAMRAVGAANGRNPLPIVVPCHRVIGSDGRLTGYGGGLHIKEALLALERSVVGKSRSAHDQDSANNAF